MKYTSYIWTIVVNLMTVGVTVAIFESTNTSFERIVLSLLILIYINLVTFVSLYGQAKSEELFAMNYEFKRLRKLLKEDVNEEDAAYEEEQLKEGKEKQSKNQNKFYISSVFLFIIYIITLFNLLGSL